jgi:hypothetical protein
MEGVCARKQEGGGGCAHDGAGRTQTGGGEGSHTASGARAVLLIRGLPGGGGGGRGFPNPAHPCALLVRARG